MKRILFLILIFLTRISAYQEAGFIQYPDIEGNQIVFVYHDDLYIVTDTGGIACKITSNIGFEYYPKFSPRAKKIAYTSQTDGGMNVFALDLEQHTNQQLTYYPGMNRVIEWMPDGKSVIFNSSRNSPFRLVKNLFSVNFEGGLPQEFSISRGSNLSFSSNHDKVVFNRHESWFWWWKRYQGSGNLDLWLYDFTENRYEKLTTYQGNDIWPMWGPDGIYFVSDREGAPNIFMYDTTSHQIQKITDLKLDGVYWPSIDSKKQKIVFVHQGKLHLLNLRNKQFKKLDVKILPTEKLQIKEFVYAKEIKSGFDLSPDLENLIFSFRGEILSVPLKEGGSYNYSLSTAAKDHSPVCSPDSLWIAWLSDINGKNEEIVLYSIKNQSTRILTQRPGFKNLLKWSDDSKKILYSTSDRKLFYYDLETNTDNIIDSSNVSEISDAAWSPDNQWVIYTRNNPNYSSSINFYDIKTKKAHTIFKNSGLYMNPVFYPNGKGILFLYANLRSVRDRQVYYLSLNQAKQSFLDKKEDQKEPSQESENQSRKVTINFHGIERRVEAIEQFSGELFNLQVTDDYLYCMKRNPANRSKVSLELFDISNKELKTVCENVTDYQISGNFKKVAVNIDGRVSIIDAGSTLSGTQEAVNTGTLKILIDRKAEWRQIFDESWRILKYHFYDPEMHGVNWDSIKVFYKKFLPDIQTRQELNQLLIRMFGELNVSHVAAYRGCTFGQNYQMPEYAVGLTGIEIEYNPQAELYQISKIFSKDFFNALRMESSLGYYYNSLKENDYLVSINSIELTKKINPYYYFYLNSPDAKIEIEYCRQLDCKKTKKVLIPTIKDESILKYNDWVLSKRHYVDSASNNRIGYIHLKNMLDEGLRQFENRIKLYHNKQGIIIDVRYNGGGVIDEKIIDILEQERYMTLRQREGFLRDRPMSGFFGPKVLLCNEYSFSNAEVVARAFQIRKLGKVIGTPTFGYVISLRSHLLIDGGIIRKPITGLWDNEGNMLESRGVQPDIIVENGPETDQNKIDYQLERAVIELMKEMKQSPKKYPVPIDER